MWNLLCDSCRSAVGGESAKLGRTGVGKDSVMTGLDQDKPGHDGKAPGRHHKTLSNS
jgi:hypothetical protein